LLKGLGWTIGNGERVRIWKDKWVLNYGNFFIGWPPVGEEDKKVKDLMNDGEAGWNEARVRATFDTSLADAILSIYLSLVGQQTVHGGCSLRAEITLLGHAIMWHV